MGREVILESTAADRRLIAGLEEALARRRRFF